VHEKEGGARERGGGVHKKKKEERARLLLRARRKELVKKFEEERKRKEEDEERKKREFSRYLLVGQGVYRDPMSSTLKILITPPHRPPPSFPSPELVYADIYMGWVYHTFSKRY
jgi:hypothetical protein